jgi:hypothetical protein
VGRTSLDAGSRARFTAAPGLDRVRVLVRGSKGWADAVSATLLVHGVASHGGRTSEPSSHIEHTSHSG